MDEGTSTTLPVTTVVVPFTEYRPNLAGLAIGLSLDTAVDYVVFVQHGTGEPLTALSLYLDRIGGEQMGVRHEPGAALSDVWNLAGVLAAHHADVQDPPAPWRLVLIDAETLPMPGSVGLLGELLDAGAVVSFLTGTHFADDDGEPHHSRHGFDGLCFAIEGEAGDRVLLTTRITDSLRVAAHDFLEGLHADDDVQRLDGFLLPR